MWPWSKFTSWNARITLLNRQCTSFEIQNVINSFSLLSYKFYYVNKCSGMDKILLIFGKQGILNQYSICFL